MCNTPLDIPWLSSGRPRDERYKGLSLRDSTYTEYRLSFPGCTSGPIHRLRRVSSQKRKIVPVGTVHTVHQFPLGYVFDMRQQFPQPHFSVTPKHC